jgi:endoglucanase
VDGLRQWPGGRQRCRRRGSHARDAEAVVGWSNDGHLFKVTPGNEYRICEYMRGEDITLLSEGTEIRFHLDVYAKK